MGKKSAHQIYAQQIAALYQHASVGLVVTPLVAAVLIYTLLSAANTRILFGWYVVFIAIVALRYFTMRLYFASPTRYYRPRKWGRLFLLGSTAAGLWWGITASVFFPAEQPVQQSVILFVAVGITSGGFSFICYRRAVYTLFTLSVLAPLAWVLFAQGDSTHSILGMLTLVSIGLILFGADRLYRASFHAFELTQERRRLIAGLSDAKQRLELANAHLLQQIHDRQEVESVLHREKEMAQITLESIGDGVITTDIGGLVQYMNPVAERLTGWRNEAARGRRLEQVFHVIDDVTREPLQGLLEQCFHGAVDVEPANSAMLLRRGDATAFAVQISVAPILDKQNAPVGAVLVFHDFTALKKMANELSHQAQHDPLTGLLNRRGFEIELRKILDSAWAPGRQCALCYLDLDEFKIVNDTCGHAAGDSLLQQLTALLRSRLRDSDVFARLGGDEFGVLLQGCSLERARTIADNLRQVASSFRFRWEDKVFEVGVSIGLVPISADDSVANLLQAADSACYIAKDKGRNMIHVYQPDDQALVERRGEMHWVQRIQHALNSGRFVLFAQAVAEVAGSSTVPAYREVLIRMLDEQDKPVAPGIFLPAAERYHLMQAIDRYVLRRALQMMLAGEIDHDTVLGINISGQSLGKLEFHNYALELIRHSGVAPERLVFEITETSAIANMSLALEFMRKLRQLGCKFALDDFGSGLSSFSYLKTLPVDYLKMDGSFIIEMADDPVSYAMTEAINRLGQILGVATIAECVENEAVLTRLRELGVNYAQGYYFEKPQPLARTPLPPVPLKLASESELVK